MGGLVVATDGLIVATERVVRGHSPKFEKGHKKVGGRPLGGKNRLTIAIRDMVLGALSDVGGQAYLARQAELNPVAFMALLGRILPLEVVGASGGPLIVEIVKFGEGQDSS